MATLQATEKKAAKAHAYMHAISLLEEEHASTIAVEAEAAMTALQLAPTIASSSVSQPPPSRGDVTIVATLHT
jgi:hypothetical protein